MTPLQRMLCVMVLMRIYGSIAENALCNGFFRALMRIGGYCRECSVASFRALMRIVWLLQRMLLCLFVLSVFLLFVRSFTDFGGWFLVVLVLRVAF